MKTLTICGFGRSNVCELPLPCDERCDIGISVNEFMLPIPFIGIDIFRTLSRIICRIVLRNAFRKSAVLFDSTYTFSERRCSCERKWINSQRKCESISLADEARTWTSVTGISTWYRMISTSFVAFLLVTPCGDWFFIWKIILALLSVCRGRNVEMKQKCTISFFFCRKRSLHRKTTADLKTKHIACNSRPFLILPKKSDIFSHSTPP